MSEKLKETGALFLALLQKLGKRICSVPSKIAHWSLKAKIIWCAVLGIAVILTVFSFFAPSESEMYAYAEEALLAISTPTRITKNYYQLWFISAVRCTDATTLQSTGQITAIGFLGRIYDFSQGGFGYDFTRVVLWMPRLFSGMLTTVQITVISGLFGLLLGVLLAIGKISKLKLLSKICSAYVFFFRGTPLLMQLFFIYYLLPQLFPALSFDQLTAAYVAFTLNMGAYMAELVRAAIQSIDKGQHEAAKVLGLSAGQTMRLIILPQSVRRLIPPVCNEFVMCLKDVSLVSIIALSDLTYTTNTIAASNATALVYIPAAVLYLLLTGVLTYIFGKLEKKYSVYE